MPRRYKRKVTAIPRTPINRENLKNAVACVVNQNAPLKGTANRYGINIMTLKRYVKAKKDIHTCPDISYSSDYTKCKTFNEAEEVSLKEYLIKASKLHDGLTMTQVRQLAYEFSTKINKKVPKSWIKNKAAGCEWMYGYMNRNPELKLSLPKATFLSRASFDRKNVSEICDNVRNVLEKNPEMSPDTSIWNIIKTGLTVDKVKNNTPVKKQIEKRTFDDTIS